ncbi:MAG: phytanoyl-CoA dioxygenase family protein [Patescibacteria group bacterium]
MHQREYTFSFWYGVSWKKFYGENGFVVIESVFDSLRCDRAVKIYEKYAMPDFRGIMNLDRGGRLEYVDKNMDIDPVDAADVRAMLKNRKIVVALDILQEEETVLLQSMFLFKRAGTPYALQAWNPHQDNAYPQAPHGWYITGNIAFSDQDPENGGMYIYPGSHREPILPNKPVKSFHEDVGTNPGHCVEVPEKYKDKKTNLILKMGSVLFLHGNVVHGSYPNNSKALSRPMLLIPYGTKGISQQPGFIAGNIAQRKEMPIR